MKIIIQSEIWIPFLEAAFSDVALTFSPKPKIYTPKDVIKESDRGTAVSRLGTYRKIFNRAIIQGHKPSDIPTHILVFGKGDYENKVIDKDITSIMSEYESKDYPIPDYVYFDVQNPITKDALNRLTPESNIEDWYQELVKSTIGESMILEAVSDEVEVTPRPPRKKLPKTV